MRSILFLTAFLSLSACRVIADPTFAPSGYTYHQDLYKSPPGPEAADIGYDYSAVRNDEVQRLWQISVSDLLNQLEDQRGEALPDTVYIRPLDHKNAFNGAFDNALRQELADRGHILTDNTGDGDILMLTIDARDPDWTQKKPQPEYNGDLEYETHEQIHKKFKDIILMIGTSRGSLIMEQASATYTLPFYGYDREAWYKKDGE
ncbi:MAG: hypothetical protein R3D66_00015 [Alphaproteobacteria bacterium]